MRIDGSRLNPFVLTCLGILRDLRPLKCVCHLLCMLKCAPCSSCLLNQFDSYSSFTFWILLLLSKIIKEYQNSNGGGDSLRLKTILLRDHVHTALFYTNKSECFRTYRPLVIIPIPTLTSPLVLLHGSMIHTPYLVHGNLSFLQDSGLKYIWISHSKLAIK